MLKFALWAISYVGGFMLVMYGAEGDKLFAALFIIPFTLVWLVLLMVLDKGDKDASNPAAK